MTDHEDEDFDETQPPTGSEPTEVLALPEEVERLVVLGDPHGDLIALDLVLGREEGEGTVIVSAGDNIGYVDGVFSSQLCAVLQARGIRSVYGNHEDWSREGTLFMGAPGRPRELTAEALAWCQALPYRIRVEAAACPDLPISIVHTLPGWSYIGPKRAARLLDLERTTITVCGHSHRPAIYALGGQARQARVRRLDPRSAMPIAMPVKKGDRYVVDAGSLARPAPPRGGSPCFERGTYAVIHLSERRVELRSIDKTARMQQLMRSLLDGNRS